MRVVTGLLIRSLSLQHNVKHLYISPVGLVHGRKLIICTTHVIIILLCCAITVILLVYLIYYTSHWSKLAHYLLTIINLMGRNTLEMYMQKMQNFKKKKIM